MAGTSGVTYAKTAGTCDTLYFNDSGTSGDITLSSDIFNYKLACVHWRVPSISTENDYFFYTDFYKNQGRFNLMMTWFMNNNVHIYSMSYYIPKDGLSLKIDQVPWHVEYANSSTFSTFLEQTFDLTLINRVYGINI